MDAVVWGGAGGGGWLGNARHAQFKAPLLGFARLEEACPRRDGAYPKRDRACSQRDAFWEKLGLSSLRPCSIVRGDIPEPGIFPLLGSTGGFRGIIIA